MGEVRTGGSVRLGAPCRSLRPRRHGPGSRKPSRKGALGVLGALGILGGCGFLLGVVPASAIASVYRLDPVRPAPEGSAPAGLDQSPLALLEAIHGAKLRASDGGTYDNFGHSVAVGGNTAVVGAHPHPAWGDAGSAYVYIRSGATWTEQTKLTASDGAANDYFGSAVALSGDTTLVGAYGDDTSVGLDAGSAYVFVRSGTVWTEQAHLIASDGAAFDFFGISVAVHGDTAVVGAVADDTPAGTDAGSAHVFVRSGTDWTEQARLTASDGANLDNFGGSVAVSGNTAVVGAYSDDTRGGLNAGSAYVFVRSGTTWTEQAHLTASDGALGDYFGGSVAVSGDTAVAGARFDDTPGGSEAGSAYVFVRSGTAWTEQAHLTASDGDARDVFGASVAVIGNAALVGAPVDTTPAGSGGSAYVFVRSGTGWTEQAHLIAPDGAPGEEFGYSVALSGDTAVVGARFDNTPAGRDAGSAYVGWRESTQPGPDRPR